MLSELASSRRSSKCSEEHDEGLPGGAGLFHCAWNKDYFFASELGLELESDFEVEGVASDFDSDLDSDFESVEEALTSDFLSELLDDDGAEFLRA
jgi:hypothetical protein